MGAYVLRKVLALPPMVEVSGPQVCIDPRRRRGDAGGIARSHVELGQVVIQKHALLHRDYTVLDSYSDRASAGRTITPVFASTLTRQHARSRTRRLRRP